MISFKIPLDKQGNAVMVFPNQCVYCGKPLETNVPITTTYSSGSAQYRHRTQVTIEVPYCYQHANRGKQLGLILNVIFFVCLLISCSTSILISFSLNLQDTFQICVLSPVLALIFAFLTGSVGIRKIWGLFNKEVRDLPHFFNRGQLGISLALGPNALGIAFNNETFAKEFGRINNLEPQQTQR